MGQFEPSRLVETGDRRRSRPTAALGGFLPVRFRATTREIGHSVHGRVWPKSERRLSAICAAERTFRSAGQIPVLTLQRYCVIPFRVPGLPAGQFARQAIAGPVASRQPSSR
jgi:hypothetical protein